MAKKTCDILMFPVGPFVDERYITKVLPMAKGLRIGTVCFKTFGAGKLLGDSTGYNQPLQQRPERVAHGADRDDERHADAERVDAVMPAAQEGEPIAETHPVPEARRVKGARPCKR